MMWKVKGTDSISIAFRKAVENFNNGCFDFFIRSNSYTWYNPVLINRTSIIVLSSVPNARISSILGVIGTFKGWKYISPLLFTCVADVYRYLDVIPDDNYKTLISAVSRGSNVMVADYSIITDNIPKPSIKHGVE